MPFTPETPMRVASVSKMAAALSAHRLAGKGALDLDVDIRGQFSPALIQALKDKGHTVNEIDMTSGTQAIVRVKDAQGNVSLEGGADPRREGEALGD